MNATTTTLTVIHANGTPEIFNTETKRAAWFQIRDILDQVELRAAFIQAPGQEVEQYDIDDLLDMVDQFCI